MTEVIALLRRDMVGELDCHQCEVDVHELPEGCRSPLDVRLIMM